MDPVHLRLEEVDYELAIRGVQGVLTSRSKTLKLREYLRKEELGDSLPPSVVTAKFTPDSEITNCAQIVSNIRSIVKEAVIKKNSLFMTESSHRVLHVKRRLTRIPIAGAEQDAAIQTIRQCLSDVEHSIAAYTIARETTTSPAVFREENRSSDFRGFNLGDLNTEAAAPLSSTFLNGTASGGNSRIGIEDLAMRPQSAFQELSDLLIPPVHGRNEAVAGGEPSYAESVRNLARHQPSSNDDSHHDRLRFLLNEIRETVFGRGTQREGQVRDVQNNDRENDRNRVHSNSHAHQSHTRMASPLRNDNNWVPDRGQQHIPRRNVYSNSGDDRNQYNAEPIRKTIPISQWKISFSGDDRGTHVYDFLSQIAMFQRSERVSDQAMLYSVVHLLSGRARLWYQSRYDEFVSWPDFVRALKAEFLPENYDYSLMSEIENRKQKPAESFSEYIIHMQSLFKWLNIELSEQHKIYIVQKNLQPKYANAIAVFPFTTLEQLSIVCRRIDNDPSRIQGAQRPTRLPFEYRPFNASSAPFRFNQRPAGVHEVETDQFAGDACAVTAPRPRYGRQVSYSGDGPNPFRGARPNGPQSSEPCFNCSRTGHQFNACPDPQKEQFCYRCGMKGVTARTCTKCTGNEARGSVIEASPQNLQK